MVGPSPRRKGPDYQAQRFNNNPDQVAQTKLFAEVYRRLEDVHVEASEFKFNPLTAAPVTPKPTSVMPSRAVTKQEFEEAQKLLDLVYPIDAPPPEKYEVPMTTSQEYGWRSQPLVKPKKLFSFPHESCEITQYASAYYQLRQVSPFAAKDFVPRYVLKERARLAAEAAAAAASAAAVAAATAAAAASAASAAPVENPPISAASRENV